MLFARITCALSFAAGSPRGGSDWEGEVCFADALSLGYRLEGRGQQDGCGREGSHIRGSARGVRRDRRPREVVRRCEGARVVAQAHRRERGLQVFKVISVAEPEPGYAAPPAPPRTRAQASAVGGFEIVIVKWFNRSRGFGFLTRGEGTEDIFVHMETMRRYGFLDPKPGDTMLARFGPGPKGLMAAEVRPLDGSKILAPH